MTLLVDFLEKFTIPSRNLETRAVTHQMCILFRAYPPALNDFY